MDNLTRAQRRKNMQNIRSAKTAPEEAVAKELRKRKIYFARNVKSITGKPDFVFRRKRVAVFVDSDFWHGHPMRCIMPKSNCSYWDQKIARNKDRDRQVNRELKKIGWKVIRIWEYSIKHSLDRSMNRIVRCLCAGTVGH